MQFLIAKPQKFHPNLVVEFFYNSTIAADKKSFLTKVILSESLTEDFSLNNSGINIFSYKEGLVQEYWTKWKHFDDKSAFKLNANRGSLELLPIMIMDIMARIVPQDDSSKVKLSVEIYKPMIALDDEVQANWASYVFSKLLENVHRAHLSTAKMKETHIMDSWSISYWRKECLR